MSAMEPSLIEAIMRLASGQHGVASVAQLDELGIGRHQRRLLVGLGVLVVEAPRVLAVAGAPESVERSQRAGLLCLGPDAVLSHEAAARLHGFDRARPDVVEFTVPRRERHSRSPFQVHSTLVLPPIDVVAVHGYPSTSATRTVIDLARLRIGRFRLEAAIDSAVRSGASSPVLLHERLTALRGKGRWGVRLLDHLLVDSGGHTMLERRFLTLMRRAGLPRPSTQLIHRRHGRAYARVDFCFEDVGIVVEVSGRKGHSSPSERACDAQRRNELQDAGRLVYEYTWEDVTRRQDHVIRTMQQRHSSACARLRHQIG